MLVSVAQTILKQNRVINTFFIRTVTKNRKRSKDKQRGQKVIDGEWAERDTVLATQLKLYFYPGDNVGCAKDYTLYALEPGKVMITSEALKPKKDSLLYPVVKSGKIIYRYFYHIIPDPQSCCFKLQDQI